MAKNFAKKRLTTPSTADFASIADSKVIPLKPCHFRVISYVDAQNLFGAKIRKNYITTTHYKADRTWSLNNMEM